MIFAYSLLLYLLVPFFYLRLYWKGRTLPAYRERTGERFMQAIPAFKEVEIWVHAVSLGEVNAILPLLKLCIEKGWTVLVTTMTPTGSKRVVELFKDKVIHQYLPYDLPHLQKKFLNYWQPKVAVIVETELWPNLIRQVQRREMGLLLVNARLSPHSFRQYRKFSWFFKPLLNCFNQVLAQSAADTERFIQLGIDKNKVKTTGNIKFDIAVAKEIPEPCLLIKQRWGEERTIVIFASTHAGEEALFLKELPLLKAELKKVLLLIAPRHPERFKEVYQLSCQMGYQTGLRSNPDSVTEANEVIILDSLGELMHWFKVSDFALIGGSFVDIGGHNVLEPLAVGVPTLTGPIYYNFKTICEDMLENAALLVVENPLLAIKEIIALNQEPMRRKVLIENARKMMGENKGAAARYMEAIAFIVEGSKRADHQDL